ncbi:hypothetical protein ACOSP7_026317 [Xanthoceras sorbifolium]
MASAAFLKNPINALQSHTRIPFGHPKLVPTKFHAILVGNSSLMQPFVAKTLTIKSQNNPSPEFKLEEYRTKKIKLINKALDEAVPLQHPTKLHEAMRYTLLAGGKRLISTLCIASCELVGGDESLAMPTVCAFEMIFTAGMIHDDFPDMDNCDIRRGKPTNHKVYGETTSILACNGLLCLAIEHIATNTENVSLDRVVRAITEVCSAAGAKGSTAGQFADINSEGQEVSLSELEFIHKHKTGKFVEAALVCGIVLGGGNEVEIERLRKFGKKVGLAYQVWDDILDINGFTEKLGKKVGNDLLRNKATYPKLMGMDESKKFATQLVAQAKEELSYFDSTMAAPLYHLADFIVSRML